MSLETATPLIDPAIITRFQTGDPAALEQIVERFGVELFAYVANRCAIDCSPEDVTQDVWLRVWRKRQQFQQGNFRGWLYQVAKNLLCDIHRKKRPTLMDDQYDPAAPDYDQADLWVEALEECLKGLSGPFLDAIRRQQQGASTKEMALEFEISEGTVSSRISRGKQLLKECVELKVR